MLTRLVHRALLLVGTARHARFRRTEPALALGEVTADQHNDHGKGRDAAQRFQHSPRMLKPAHQCQPSGLTGGVLRRPYMLTPAYRSNAKSVAREQIALAGARLASVLNAELK